LNSGTEFPKGFVESSLACDPAVIFGGHQRQKKVKKRLMVRTEHDGGQPRYIGWNNLMVQVDH